MSRLSLTLTPSPFEPATSFASRLAQRNGHAFAQDFVLDMGLDWRALAAGYRPQTVELAAIASADPNPLIRFTPSFGEGKRVAFAGEIFPHKSFEVKCLDICPLCVAEALSTDRQHLNAGSKAWWPLRYARACEEHGIRLVRLPPPEAGRHKHDYAGRVRDCAALILREAGSAHVAEAQPFDQYFADRLKGQSKRPPSWLDDVELSVAGQVCEILGLLLLDGPKSRPTGKDEDHLARAANRGYAALAGGRETFWPALEGVLRKSSAARGGPNADFPHLHGLLTRLPSTSGVELLRGEVRAFCLEHYPLGAGDAVYGVEVGDRTLHSPSTIAQDFGCPSIRVTRLIRGFRTLGPPMGLPAPDHRLQVSAVAWRGWLETYSRSLNTGDAADSLKVCRDFFQKIVGAGWIEPFFELDGHQTRYDPNALDRLPRRFLDRCDLVELQPSGRLPLFDIASSCQISPLDVLRSVEDREQVVGTKLSGAARLQDIFVDREQVLDAFEGPPISGLTYQEAREYLRSGTITLNWLMQEGLLPVTREVHPRTRTIVNRFSDEAVQAFGDRFRTSGQIAAVRQTTVRKIARELSEIGIPHLQVPPKVTAIFSVTDLPPDYR